MNNYTDKIAIGWDVGGWSGKNHGFAIIRFENNKINLEYAGRLSIFSVQDKLRTIIAENQNKFAVTIAVDAPLSFPLAFSALIDQDFSHIMIKGKGSSQQNPLAWRQTDLHIKSIFKKTPLSPSFSFLTSNATAAMTVLNSLKTEFIGLSILPFSDQPRGSFTAFEAYPGLFKSPIFARSLAYKQYLKLLEEHKFFCLNGFDYYFEDSSVKTDVADAVLCSLFALSFGNKLSDFPQLKETIPEHLVSIAKKEGWIYYPVLD